MLTIFVLAYSEFFQYCHLSERAFAYFLSVIACWLPAVNEGIRESYPWSASVIVNLVL